MRRDVVRRKISNKEDNAGFDGNVHSIIAAVFDRFALAMFYQTMTW